MGQARLPLAVRGRPASCSESAAAQHMAWCQSKPALPTARGREARTPVETTVARKRLEEMRDDLDRTISVLQGILFLFILLSDTVYGRMNFRRAKPQETKAHAIAA